MKNKLSEAAFIINRYDFYYESVNSKGNVYFALNTFILGGTITGYYSLNKELHFDYFFFCLFILILLSNIASLLFTIGAVHPFLWTQKTKIGKSILYFNDVASRSLSEYKSILSKMSNDERLDDYTSQIHSLAKGLKLKYTNLQMASLMIIIESILIVLFGVLIYLI